MSFFGKKTAEMANNNNTEPQDREELDIGKNKIVYKLRSGEEKQFEVSVKSCEAFGFYYGERVKVRGGKKAWVVGVRRGEGKPNLFFHIDGDKGASYYSNYRQAEFEKEGFVLISPRCALIDSKRPYFAPELKTLLNDDTFSDVCFKVDNTHFKAHRNILVARSEYFRAMFKGGMRERKEKVIPIQGVDEAAFQALLEFLYTGKVDLNENTIVPLLSAAQLFQIDDLKNLCCNSFHDVTTEQNVVQLLFVANSCEDEVLKSLCKKFILDHYDSLSDSTNFKSLISEDNRDLVLELMKEMRQVPSVSTPSSSSSSTHNNNAAQNPPEKKRKLN